MGIYIPGIETPKGHNYVTITIWPSGTASYGLFDREENLCDFKSIKAVPVPPHYDLIDHNALKIAVMNCDAETRLDFLKHAMDCINKAPVVIPSDMPTYEEQEGET